MTTDVALTLLVRVLRDKELTLNEINTNLTKLIKKKGNSNSKQTSRVYFNLLHGLLRLQ